MDSLPTQNDGDDESQTHNIYIYNIHMQNCNNNNCWSPLSACLSIVSSRSRAIYQLNVLRFLSVHVAALTSTKNPVVSIVYLVKNVERWMSSSKY